MTPHEFYWWAYRHHRHLFDAMADARCALAPTSVSAYRWLDKRETVGGVDK